MRDHHGDEITVHITGGPDCHGLHHLLHCGTAGGDERLVRSVASPSHCGIARRARATHDGRGETEGQEESIAASHCCLPVISGFGAALAPGFVLRAHRALATRTRAPSCRSVGGLITMSRSEEHTSELQSRLHLVCRLLLEKKKKTPSRPNEH